MLEMYPDLVKKIKDLNENLHEIYQKTPTDNETIRQKLQDADAEIRHISRLSTSALSHWLQGKELAGVDGSVNQTKGEAPHILYLFQALAKTTTGYECKATDLFSPLLHNEETEEEDKPVNYRSHLLAKLELKVAIQLMEERSLAILIMDGALYHYRIDAPEEWDLLRKMALEKNVLLVGVSEEITTANLVKLEAFEAFSKQPHTYDRDLLFGVLKQEEMVFVENIQSKAGLQSVWMRLTSDPAITGFDVLEEQASYKEEIASLLLTLTPRDGRGIPLWLDHIDREVRVTDKLVEALVEQYIETDIRKRFFEKKRAGRPY
ncbi:DNA double-strand break repair nuclease NurA [Alkalihalobacillus sp. MEB130]|uniref:DNA double-strand break repair nuclease NurA n=1 Tax=Alkalihalobacillus sp. MEB130 TaxID=2976704 RepID=UPI0028DF9C12|nr:DNA double-strand break repair nuclease NurA [Alkalihalobacillus sp. MEB130]MDT8862630.1 DNA double-strand break repair nuclease NurA [Alkalihalobacillus sp. MEB130]